MGGINMFWRDEKAVEFREYFIWLLKDDLEFAR
jgi:hypothetical protein